MTNGQRSVGAPSRIGVASACPFPFLSAAHRATLLVIGHWPLVIVFLLLAAVARADLVIVQKVEGGGLSGDQTLHIKDDQARCDVAGAFSLLVNRKTGETTTLSHGQKGYMTVSPETSAAMIARLRGARGSDAPPALVATGKKEKIGDYQCELFTAELGGVKATYWLAKDYPNYPALLAQMDIVESNPLSGAAGGVAPRTKDLPGMPMKILMEMNGQKITVTLVSAKEEPVDPAIFKIPDDYKELPAAPPGK